MTKEIDNLIARAQEEDPNLYIILSAYMGAKLTGLDGVLAQTVQHTVRTILIPAVQQKRNDALANMN